MILFLSTSFCVLLFPSVILPDRLLKRAVIESTVVRSCSDGGGAFEASTVAVYTQVRF